MDRLKCQIRAREASDDSTLLLLAEENLKPQAESHGRGADFRARDLLRLLQSAEVYVAECQGNVAGFVAIVRHPPDLAIETICLSPAYEARGVAHQLLDWVEGLAYSSHAERLETLVAADDRRAHAFFAGRGFTAVTSKAGEQLLERRLPGSPPDA
jgi:N-acetylglutamate synthase-like GNAT family acetyltransferase